MLEESTLINRGEINDNLVVSYRNGYIINTIVLDAIEDESFVTDFTLKTFISAESGDLLGNIVEMQTKVVI